MSVTIRRAEPDDADFLAEIVVDGDVEPFLGPNTASTREAVLAEIERSQAEPETFGRFVVEQDGERAGTMGFHLSHEASRIARLERLAVDPRFRGRRVADEGARLLQRLLLEELGYHRLELAIYAFNERACAHAERSGFVREGVRRKVHERHGEWQDIVIYALLAEDL